MDIQSYKVERVEIDTSNPIASAIGRAKFVIGEGDEAVDHAEQSIQDPPYKQGRKAIDEAAGNVTQEAGEFIGEKLGEVVEKGVKKIVPKALEGVAGLVAKKGAEKLGGYLAETGLADTLSEAVPDFAGSQHLASEVSQLTDTIEEAAMLKGGVKLAKKGLEKLGRGKNIAALEKAIGKVVHEKVIAKLAKFRNKKLFNQLMIRAGGKMSVLATTTATPIPLDDVIGWGAAGLMAVDVYEITMLIKKAVDISNAVEELSTRPIADIRGVDEASQKNIDEALELSGKTMENMTDVEKMNFIKSLTDVRIKITYQNSSDYQLYRFVQGEVFAAEIKRGSQVLQLTDEELNKDVALPPPQKFKKVTIDYKNDPDLPLKYRYAFLKLKSDMGWTKLDYGKMTDNVIEIKRLDGNRESTYIRRTGDKWSIPEGAVEGLDLEQAIIMSNLLNKVKTVIKDGEEVGGSDRPFYDQSGTIMFDRKNNFWNNLDVLTDGQWRAFFESNQISTSESKISKYKIIGMLNSWYQNYGSKGYKHQIISSAQEKR